MAIHIRDVRVGRCDCARCAEGVLTAGHCVDIDGDYWHDCPAVDAANTEQNETSWHPPNDLYPEED